LRAAVQGMAEAYSCGPAPDGHAYYYPLRRKLPARASITNTTQEPELFDKLMEDSDKLGDNP
jgi:hypothetical protein